MNCTLFVASFGDNLSPQLTVSFAKCVTAIAEFLKGLKWKLRRNIMLVISPCSIPAMSSNSAYQHDLITINIIWLLSTLLDDYQYDLITINMTWLLSIWPHYAISMTWLLSVWPDYTISMTWLLLIWTNYTISMTWLLSVWPDMLITHTFMF